MREKYILADAEIEALIHGLIENGPKNMYELMKGKVAAMALTSEDIDLILMDMRDSLIDMGREIILETQEDTQLRDIYYILASMLRKLAQNAHSDYSKAGKNKEDDRFLRLVSHNKESPPHFNSKE